MCDPGATGTGSPLGCAAESESAKRAEEPAGASVPCSAVQPPAPPVSGARLDRMRRCAVRRRAERGRSGRARPCRGAGPCVLAPSGSGEVWCESSQPLLPAALAPRRTAAVDPSPRAAFRSLLRFRIPTNSCTNWMTRGKALESQGPSQALCKDLLVSHEAAHLGAIEAP